MMKINVMKTNLVTSLLPITIIFLATIQEINAFPLPRTAALDIINGRIRASNSLACGTGTLISVQNVSIISSSIVESNTDVESGIGTGAPTPSDPDEIVLLKELKYAFNFKNSSRGGEVLPSLTAIGSRQFTAKVNFNCYDSTKGCDGVCKNNDNGETCMANAGGDFCECLSIPTEESNWTGDEQCSGAEYLGCKVNSLDEHAVHVNISKYLSPKVCIRLCQMMGYMVAVLSGDNHGCYCQQNSFNNYDGTENLVAEEKCLYPCKYDPDSSCGNFPYQHFYTTGIVGPLEGVCTEKRCANGTYCRKLFDTEFCVCNQSSTEKPAECYGCLPGWFSLAGYSNCYRMVDMSVLTENKMDAHCQSIYGKLFEPRDMKTMMLLVRMTLEKLVAQGRHRDTEEEMEKLLEGSTDLLLRGLPLCQRPKANVTGKFPWTKWPKGMYGLPMAQTECPRSVGFDWLNGSYVQDTEDTDNGNKVSNQTHLMGSVNSYNITQHYCIKASEQGEMEWPRGRYCIYKVGDCPRGMKNSTIFWDDEDNNNTNHAKGILPDGMFKADTLVYYCCMDEELNTDGIILPRDKPFYLFPYKSSECQHVVGTQSTLEYIQYDLENDYGWIAEKTAFGKPTAYAEITEPNKHLKLFYCYYEPIRSCGVPLVGSNSITFTQTEFRVGHIINYTCPAGYLNVGDRADTCLPSESWSSLKGAICQDINECSSKRHHHQCHKKANCYNTEGSYYCKCNPGWKGDGRNCQYIRCSLPSSITNGVLIPQNPTFSSTTFLQGAKISLQCSAGFALIGYKLSTCQSTGEWSTFGRCAEKSTCLEHTYKCNDENKYCNCVERINDTNSTETTNVTTQSKRWPTTVIAVTSTLIVLIVIVIVGFIISFHVKYRSKKKERRETQSIYADINEIQFDLKYNGRKPSTLSTFTSCSSPTTPNTPYPLPPRSSICSSSSFGISGGGGGHHYRRRSDFGCSNMDAIHPKQFSTIFGRNKNLNATTSAPPHTRDTFNQSTQFKLNSITKNRRRSSVAGDRYRRSSCCPPFNNNTRMPSTSFLENITEYTTPILEAPYECDNTFGDENPYIDVIPDFTDTENEDDDDGNDTESSNENCSFKNGHYMEFPRNTAAFTIGRRERSKTTLNGKNGYELAKDLYVDALKREMCSRSKSLPEGEMNALFNELVVDTNNLSEMKKSKSRLSVQQQQQQQQKMETQVKKRNMLPLISLKLKLKAVGSKNKKKNNKRKISSSSYQENVNCEVEIRNDVNNDATLRRFRACTMPY